MAASPVSRPPSPSQGQQALPLAPSSAPDALPITPTFFNPNLTVVDQLSKQVAVLNRQLFNDGRIRLQLQKQLQELQYKLELTRLEVTRLGAELAKFNKPTPQLPIFPDPTPSADPQIEALQQQLEATEQKAHQLESEIGSLRTEVERLETVTAEQATDILTRQANNSTLLEEIEDLNGICQKQRDSLRELEQAHLGDLTRLNELTEEHATTLQGLGDLKSKHDEQNVICQEQLTLLRTMKEQYQSLESSFQALKEELANTHVALQKLKSEKQSAVEEQAGLELSLRSAQYENGELKKQISSQNVLHNSMVAVLEEAEIARVFFEYRNKIALLRAELALKEQAESEGTVFQVVEKDEALQAMTARIAPPFPHDDSYKILRESFQRLNRELEAFSEKVQEDHRHQNGRTVFNGTMVTRDI